ncbi:O-glucosyltransferase rumi homolog isoform X2 [Ananas comosus]|uniref:O-glucosyltransferase rumi homolog isoform X2 n=1 Tax=Ananas comosus TaxID=4615 RepID=A0A6P5EAF3_ANACO|nr:O-glucosyltransferase rumi homolog isoform X2 [Ananas comosus]
MKSCVDGEEGMCGSINEKRKSAIAAIKSSTRGVGIVFVALFLLVVLIPSRWIDRVSFVLTNNEESSSHGGHAHPKKSPRIPISFTCPNATSVERLSCTRRAPPLSTSPSPSPSPTPSSSSSEPSPSTAATTAAAACPGYFRYIHEDLRPWRGRGGITRAAVEEARSLAHFRLVVLGGRAFVEHYSGAFQTRDVFTLWGVLQLLARYPGRVPDLDLMFNCDDPPVVRFDSYRAGEGPSAPPLPPLFRYCKEPATADIVFPDWSFWGWPEVNIKPWEPLLVDLKEGNERVKWKDREPYAFWKGNPWVAGTRQDLLKCNVSNGREWNARLFTQNWESEIRNGFKGSNLADQCLYRYKIYIEGRAWSVSEKYILACNSPTLLVTSMYQDFFTRGLMPGHHYWPIRPDHKCPSIKFAVDWGNKHQKEAQAIGKAGSGFIQEEVKMDYVYDYMLHLLTEYAKLLRYKPTVPEKATELCLESMACAAEGLVKTFMMDSRAKWVHDSEPCTLPPSFDPKELKEISKRKDEAIKQVEMWERKA